MLWPCFKYFRQNLEVDKETERSNFEFLLDRIVDIKPVYLLCTAFLSRRVTGPFYNNYVFSRGALISRKKYRYTDDFTGNLFDRSCSQDGKMEMT